AKGACGLYPHRGFESLHLRQSKFKGSTPLKGDGHSSNTVNYTIPTALGQDPQPVIFKIPKAIRTTREHFHFGMESLGDAVGLGETPHRHNGFKPRAQRRR